MATEERRLFRFTPAPDDRLLHECHRCHVLADDTELALLQDPAEGVTYFVHREACS